MEVDGAVASEGIEIVGPAVVLVDDPADPIAHHQRRVTAGAIGDAGLGVDRDGESVVEAQFLAIGRADEPVEPQ